MLKINKMIKIRKIWQTSIRIKEKNFINKEYTPNTLFAKNFNDRFGFTDYFDVPELIASVRRW